MDRKIKPLRDEIKEVLGSLVESVGPARILQTRLLELQRAAMATRKGELQQAEDAMRDPAPRSAEVMAEAVLITDALDAVSKVLAGSGVCGGVLRGIQRAEREARITPLQRKAATAAAYQRAGEAIKLGQQAWTPSTRRSCTLLRTRPIWNNARQRSANGSIAGCMMSL